MNPKAIARTALTFLGSSYYRLRATKPLWLTLNREARRLYQHHPQALSSPEAKAAQSLQETGIAVTAMSDFFPPGTFEALAHYARTRWQSPEVASAAGRHREVLTGTRAKTEASKKAFLVNLWPGEPVLDLSHPFIRFSLSDPILKIVNAYLGLWAKFRAWRLEATIPMPEGVGARASQRWHRDEEDQKLVKVFLYLSDVDEMSGPFMYLKHSHAGGKWRYIFPLAPPRGSRKMPPNEDGYIPKGDVLVCTAKAGTLIFCDTTGLHKGGLITAGGESRLMYTSVYTSSASPWPIRYRYPSTWLGISPSGLSPMARYAAENDPNQREPRFYR